MHPVLFSIGRRTIYSYTVAVDLCLLVALLWLAWQDRHQQDGRLDAALWAAAFGLPGARLAHILVNGSYYAERPVEALALAQGGLSLHGGLLTGLLGLAAFALVSAPQPARPLTRYLNLVAALTPALALGLLGGWLGCLLGGCAYGRPLPPPQPFYAVDWPDLYGVDAFRLPSQLLGLALALLVLAVAWRPVVRRGPSQAPAGAALALYGLGDCLIAATRGDLQVAWGPLGATQWADLALALIGLLLLAYARHTGRAREMEGRRP